MSCSCWQVCEVTRCKKCNGRRVLHRHVENWVLTQWETKFKCEDCDYEWWED